MSPRVALALTLLLLAASTHAAAEVTRVQVDARTDLLGGAPFPGGGAYEKLVGIIHFEFDPAHPANAGVVDLARAPRNARGRVEADADFMVLRPRRPPDAGGTVLLEISNRGGKALLPYLNGGAWSADPTAAGDFGDGLLMRLGLTIVWVGWQFDAPARPHALRLRVPVATQDGRPIEGLVRSDWTVDEPVRTLPLAHREHRAYPVADPDHADNVLTVRDGRLARRTVVPRSRWRFAREVEGRLVEDREHVTALDGFQPGRIYELVYRARQPSVVGLGLAAMRDVAAYAKHDPASVFPARFVIAAGISQSGRFLRHFLYQGFNTDEAGRPAFDGMLVHTAGAGRGSFNHRFAQPSRDAHRFSAFFYPTDLFPFSGRTQEDRLTGARDGLLARALAAGTAPKVMYTNTGYEYWGRAASLLHTTPDGTADVVPLPSERIYHLASGQHFVGSFPPAPRTAMRDAHAYRDNPLDFLVTLRALLVRLVDWVVTDRPPPASAHPTLAAKTLVTVDRLAFPAIPGVRVPRVAHEAHRVDYGPGWAEGIVTREPPGIGPAFPALVSQVDADGNEGAGLRAVELHAPLGTYAPWSLRADPPTAELMDFFGTWAPLPWNEAERRRAGDPRPSIERRYGTRARYLAAVGRAADGLLADGVLLPEDRARVMRRAEQQWDWLAQRGGPAGTSTGTTGKPAARQPSSPPSSGRTRVMP